MNVVDEEVVRRIQQKLGGPGCLHGYRVMWHVPRSRSFVDRCLRRARNYVSEPSPNSNYSWHIANDKTRFQVVIALFKIFRDDHFFSIKFLTTFWAMNEWQNGGSAFCSHLFTAEQ